MLPEITSLVIKSLSFLRLALHNSFHQIDFSSFLASWGGFLNILDGLKLIAKSLLGHSWGDFDHIFLIIKSSLFSRSRRSDLPLASIVRTDHLLLLCYTYVHTQAQLKYYFPWAVFSPLLSIFLGTWIQTLLRRKYSFYIDCSLLPFSLSFSLWISNHGNGWIDAAGTCKS